MHLSSEQLSQWIAGDVPAEHREHMHECDECRAAVREVQNTLSGYGDFARDWGRRETPSAPSLSQLLHETRRPARFAKWTGLAAAFTAALLVFLVPRGDEERKTQPVGAESIPDTLLLQQVNAQLSRTAPMAMEPLLILLEDKDPTGDRPGEER